VSAPAIADSKARRRRRVPIDPNIGFVLVVVPIFASQQSQLTLFTVVLILGLLVGVFGHIIHSRPLILTGILVIGLVSAYFAFVLQPGG
jgi:hypothetical protein